jgi:group I intron endonuclease
VSDILNLRMLIYAIRNIITGKQYVGKTTKSAETRWKQHVRTANSGRNSCFHAAIREHGPAAFIWYVLSEALNAEVADKLERFWIRELNTFDPVGYNRNNGGAARPSGFRHRPETRSKMSAARMGHKAEASTLEKQRKRALGNSYHLGHKATPEARARMSAAQRRRYARA